MFLVTFFFFVPFGVSSLYLEPNQLAQFPRVSQSIQDALNLGFDSIPEDVPSINVDLQGCP